ncbi:hypothetical protein [Hymenobacter psychrophilus]|uniref:Uncharacterized protein n=1 Tax=Hymenobacter psychrophilus TaxID=651662 RepID=A0A1H3MWA3_9BACT|nr:hypothetical protein [Hymenobacter psychrophilus]SDY80249.1 hypothetical protein SAMN04488069_1149 [Hymenobacter psychrophilus]
MRENLRMRDSFFRNDEAPQLRIVEVTRRFRPELILTSPNQDRTPGQRFSGRVTIIGG